MPLADILSGNDPGTVPAAPDTSQLPVGNHNLPVVQAVQPQAPQNQISKPSLLRTMLAGMLMGSAAGMAQRNSGQAAAAGAQAGAGVSERFQQQQVQDQQNQQQQQEHDLRMQMYRGQLHAQDVNNYMLDHKVSDMKEGDAQKLVDIGNAKVTGLQGVTGFTVYGQNMSQDAAQKLYMERAKNGEPVTYAKTGIVPKDGGGYDFNYTVYNPGDPSGLKTLSSDDIASLKNFGVKLPPGATEGAKVPPQMWTKWMSDAEAQHKTSFLDRKMVADTKKSEADATTATAKAGVAGQESQIDLKTKQAELAGKQLDNQKKKSDLDGKAAGMSHDEIVNGMLDGSVDITKTASIRGNQREQYIKEAKQKDPSFSMMTYPMRLKMAQDFASGKKGDQVIALNTFAGHAGDANDLIQSIRNTNSPLLNKPLNAVRTALGNDKVAPLDAALAASREEYMNFLKAGHAPTKDEIELGDRLLNSNQTPAQAQSTLKQMGKTVMIRANSLDSQHKQVMGKEYPNMFNDQSAQVMRDFGHGKDLERFGIGGKTPAQRLQGGGSQPQAGAPQQSGAGDQFAQFGGKARPN
jgi:hypothetical protein